MKRLLFFPVLLLSSCVGKENTEFPVLPPLTRIEATINDTTTKTIIAPNQIARIVALADEQRSNWTPSGGVQHFPSDIQLTFYAGQSKQREWVLSPDGFSEGFGQSGNLSATDKSRGTNGEEVIKQIPDAELQALLAAIGPIKSN